MRLVANNDARRLDVAPLTNVSDLPWLKAEDRSFLADDDEVAQEFTVADSAVEPVAPATGQTWAAAAIGCRRFARCRSTTSLRRFAPFLAEQRPAAREKASRAACAGEALGHRTGRVRLHAIRWEKGCFFASRQTSPKRLVFP